MPYKKTSHEIVDYRVESVKFNLKEVSHEMLVLTRQTLKVIFAFCVAGATL